MKQLRLTAILILIIPLLPAFLFFPYASSQAVLQGLSIWREILLPALFPFFVLTEWMAGLGLVKMVGVMFGPLMRPVFRLPGSAGFVLLFGFVSGYPVAAKLTASLLKNNQLSQSEAERLVGCATTADPMFLIGAVAVGFFGRPELALPLIISHYIASLILLVGTRWQSVPSDTGTLHRQSLRQLPAHALAEWRAHRNQDARSFVEILRDAIQSSLQVIFLIGCLVVFFCIYVSLLTSMRSMNYVYSINFLPNSIWTDTAKSLAKSMFDGMFEVTLGVKQIAALDDGSLLFIVIAAFILSWGGLSVHAQIMSLIQNSGVRYVAFASLRFCHGVIAMIIVWIIYKFN